MPFRPENQGVVESLGGSANIARLVVVAAGAIGLILFVAFVTARLVAARTRGVSIRMQVFLALAAIVGAFAFGLGIMVIDRIESRAVRLAKQAAEEEGAVIAGMIEGQMARSGASIGEIAGRFQAERLRGAHLSVELLDRDGRVVFPVDGHDVSGASGTVSVDVPVLADASHAGTVRVVKPTVVMGNMLADFAPTVLVISLVLGAAAALAAAWIGRAIAAPIESISMFAERVSEGDRTASLPISSGREVTRLWRAIDSMQRQLEGRPFVEMFAADLSHELKNPVAAIRASAEVLEEGAIDDATAARRFVGRIREATERIERLLRELLGLASIEARGVEGFAFVDLSRLASGIVESLDEQRGRTDFRTEGDTHVRGDEAWLGRAVQNLVSNALVHSEASARVSVGVLRVGNDVIVRVENPGTIPAHVRQRAFRRFVTTRADKGGTGLGLAIARAVAEAHGGRAELAHTGPPSVEFRLRLPAARPVGS
ncbi:MAG TPA: ATP-binding protein [Polyangiaceae bacterium]|jgi:signal transduction histidine kinase|nr:ATP-binding protein [Polyangiaceae bacterium]